MSLRYVPIDTEGMPSHEKTPAEARVWMVWCGLVEWKRSAVHHGVECIRVKPLVTVTGDHDLDSVVATEGVHIVDGLACFLQEVESSATVSQRGEDFLAGGVGDGGRHQFVWVADVPILTTPFG